MEESAKCVAAVEASMSKAEFGFGDLIFRKEER